MYGIFDICEHIGMGKIKCENKCLNVIAVTQRCSDGWTFKEKKERDIIITKINYIFSQYNYGCKRLNPRGFYTERNNFLFLLKISK